MNEISGYRFENVSHDARWRGNCQVCGPKAYRDNIQTALIVTYWRTSPALPASLYLCAEHAEQLARYIVTLDNLRAIFPATAPSDDDYYSYNYLGDRDE